MGLFSKNEKMGETGSHTNTYQYPTQPADTSGGSKFYVFIADAGNGQQNSFGASLGMLYGNLYGSGDVNLEANKLKNRYDENKDMEVITIQHSEWSPIITAKSIGGGMSSVDFELSKNLKGIEKHLKSKGHAPEQVSTALSICTEKNLISTDSTVGRFFVGVPFAVEEKPQQYAAPVSVPMSNAGNMAQPYQAAYNGYSMQTAGQPGATVEPNQVSNVNAAQVAFCTKCGNKVGTTANFCAACGNRIAK